MMLLLFELFVEHVFLHGGFQQIQPSVRLVFQKQLSRGNISSGTVQYFRKNCDSFVANVPYSFLLAFKDCLNVCTNLSASPLVAG